MISGKIEKAETIRIYLFGGRPIPYRLPDRCFSTRQQQRTIALPDGKLFLLI
jgi:hypothetical protein